MTTFVLSGDLRATTFTAIHASLSMLGRSVTVHHDVDLDWYESDIVDVTFESSAALDGKGCDYLVRGKIHEPLEAAVARVHLVADAFARSGIAYRFELDREDGHGQTVVIQSQTLPGYRAD